IRDLEIPPNDFDPTRPGGTWIYNLVDPVPSIALISPPDNSAFLVGTNISIQAVAFDNDGTIARVDFFANGSTLGGLTTAPYTLTWSNVPPGEYQLCGVATDNIGLRGTSAPVSITVVTSLPIVLVRGPYLQVGTPTSGVVRW